jgi:hypothetical protein
MVTSQKITTYYERYKTIEVTFSKEITHVTGLVTQQVHLKCGSDFWPCVIYSTSFEGAKVVVSMLTGLAGKLKEANNMVSLRFCFADRETGNPVTFFVAARVAGYSPYGSSQENALFNLGFTQRPPDDLIEIVGKVLDANVNSAKRKNERIPLNPDAIRKLSLLSRETAVFIQSVPRRCMLRDLSFGGAKVIMMGVAKFLIDRDVGLRLDFDDPRDSFMLKGKFVQAEEVEGKKELVALEVEYTEGHIPLGYKLRLSEYLGPLKVPATETAKPAPSAAAPSPSSAPPPAAAEQPQGEPAAEAKA